METACCDAPTRLPLDEESLRHAFVCDPGFAEHYTADEHRQVLACALALAGKRELGDAADIMRDVLTGLNALEALARARLPRPKWSRSHATPALRIARGFYLRHYDRLHPEAASARPRRQSAEAHAKPAQAGAKQAAPRRLRA